MTIFCDYANEFPFSIREFLGQLNAEYEIR
jgi:hypothetical protein